MNHLSFSESHIPVLLKEFLSISKHISSKTPKIWDATLGTAGHLIKWIEYDHPNGIAFACDCDQYMIMVAKERLRRKKLLSKVKIRCANYVDNPFKAMSSFDIIFLDLGISSLHLDHFDRGMSYKRNEILDMRLDQRNGIPVHSWLENATENEIKKILFEFSEERLAPKIAREIILRRDKNKEGIMYTEQIKEICSYVYRRFSKSKSRRHTIRHPYVKTFQAFRIHINNELTHLQKALSFMPQLLNHQGKLIVISFHSLEDRIIKHTFKKLAEKTDNKIGPKFEVMFKKPLRPQAKEISENPRSRSAKLRVLKRIDE